MTENPPFTMIGDSRDIPMALGLIMMVWNACELKLRMIVVELASKGSLEHSSVVEPLVSEMGSVGLTQALACYAHELPDEEFQIAAAISHAVQVIETCRAYRNYYVHSIRGVSKYGIEFTFDMVERDVPLHEAMKLGPFASVYSKTAKGKKKFIVDYITKETLIDFNNYLADVDKYLNDLSIALGQYLRRVPTEKREAPPPLLRVLSALKKPVPDHPKLKRPPALAPWPSGWDNEDEDEGGPS